MLLSCTHRAAIVPSLWSKSVQRTFKVISTAALCVACAFLLRHNKIESGPLNIWFFGACFFLQCLPRHVSFAVQEIYSVCIQVHIHHSHLTMVQNPSFQGMFLSCIAIRASRTCQCEHLSWSPFRSTCSSVLCVWCDVLFLRVCFFLVYFLSPWKHLRARK